MLSVPVAVPDKIFGLALSLDFIDRCHSLGSLFPPPAAVASFPDGAAASLTDLCHSLWSLYLSPAALPSLPHAT